MVCLLSYYSLVIIPKLLVLSCLVAAGEAAWWWVVVTLDLNVFKGIAKNPIFIAIIIFTVGSQYLLIEYGGDWVRTVPLNADQYYHTVILGGLSLTLGGLMRCFPVAENENDFAPMSPIMKKLQRESPIKSQANAISPSYFVWVFFAGLFPGLVYQAFGEKWLSRIQGH